MQTIEWQPFGSRHKAYIRKGLDSKMSVAEGSVRAGKTIDNCILASAYLETCQDIVHLASGSTIANAKLNIGYCNGFGLECLFKGRCRWGTTNKIQCMQNYGKGCVEYIGIAFDEPKRLEKERKGNKQFPLAEWKMTEKDCLEYCYDKGYNWNEDGIDLYQILDRVSCWCCANKNLKELRNYYLYLPKYWERLKELQKRTDRPFKNNKYTIFDLEKKFREEQK